MRRRRFSGYQYGPTDQLAPLSSASGVIRKFSQPFTMPWAAMPLIAQHAQDLEGHPFEPAGDDHLPAAGDDSLRRRAPVGLGSGGMADHRAAGADEAGRHRVVAELADDGAARRPPVVSGGLALADALERRRQRADVAQRIDVAALVRPEADRARSRRRR